MTDGKLTAAEVTETGASAFSVLVKVSGHEFIGDETLEAGGGNLGPSPYDTLLAALGECTAMTVRWYARQQKWPLEKVSVSLTHHKEHKTDIFSKTIEISGNDLSHEQRRKLIEIAAKCPIQRTLEGTPVIQTVSA